MKVDKIAVGQVWRNNDPRVYDVVGVEEKKVVMVDGPWAVLVDLVTGRKSKVAILAFLERQGQSRGYVCVKNGGEGD